MRRIQQRNESDCGVACVAMLADVSYEKAYAAVYGNGRRGLTSSGKLAAALRKLGRPPLARRMVPKRRTTLASLPHDALLKVQPSACSTKHWIIWDHKRQIKLDPYPTKMRYKVVCYLLVP
jgi:hypothetical protein